MNSIDIRAEVHRVIGGKKGGPAIAFPNDPTALDLVVHTTRTFLTHAGALTDAQRVQFIRKFAVYVTRTGWGEFDTINHVAGLIWFADHPHHLATRLGFGSAIQAQYEAYRRSEKTARVLSENEVIADLNSDPQPKPVLLTRGDFVLEQLVHAAHLLETGLALNNCLKTPFDDRCLPNTHYWTPVKHGQRHLFTVRHRDRVCFLVQITKGRVNQVQIDRAPPEFFAVFPVFADRIQELLGPVEAGAFPSLWPTPIELPQPSDPGQLAFFMEDEI
jgi:hypothetical protein